MFPTSSSKSSGASAGTKGMEIVVCEYCGKAEIFTERSGRGIFAEAHPDVPLWAAFFIPNEGAAYIHKFDTMLQEFMTARGTTWSTFAEEHMCKLVTSNGALAARGGVRCSDLKGGGVLTSKFRMFVSIMWRGTLGPRWKAEVRRVRGEEKK